MKWETSGRPVITKEILPFQGSGPFRPQQRDTFGEKDGSGATRSTVLGENSETKNTEGGKWKTNAKECAKGLTM